MPFKQTDEKRLYMREYCRNRREYNRKLINRFKVSKGCADCGYKKHPAALTFDHNPGTKHHNWHKGSLINMSRQKMKQELSNCTVRCANCHNIKTFENREHITVERM